MLHHIDFTYFYEEIYAHIRLGLTLSAFVLNDRYKKSMLCRLTNYPECSAMPWKKNFDLDEATAKATKVFWAKGYEATSITDLVNAMEVNKGSLYNAFGSKKDLFIRSLLQYDRLYRQHLLAEMADIDDPVVAIKTLFDRMIEESESDNQRKGCLLVNTALDLPNHDPDVQKMVKSALLEFEQFFESSVKIGHQQGTISTKIDPQTAAKSLLALVVGLRVLARGVFDRGGLNAIRDQAMQIIDG